MWNSCLSNIMLSTLLVLIPSVICAQSILWDKSYGGVEGPSQDLPHNIHKLDDGGFIVTGMIQSTGGDASFIHGDKDFWILRLDRGGDLLWEKTFGGSSEEGGASNFDGMTSSLITSDKTIIMTGYTKSDDGDVSKNEDRLDTKAWVINVDLEGNLLWEKTYTFGEDSNSISSSIIETSNGDFVIAGRVWHLENTNGGFDYWVLKIDNTGNLLWSTNYGGSKSDRAESVQELGNGDLFVVGTTESIDGDVSTNYGGDDGTSDIWIIRLNSNGDLIWEQNYGGSKREDSDPPTEEKASAVIDANGNLTVAATTMSTDFDVASGVDELNSDIWVFQIDGEGNINWEHVFGGDLDQKARDIVKTNSNNFFVVGSTVGLASRDIEEFIGAYDAWIFKINNEGSLLWEHAFGGTNSEFGQTIEQNGVGNYVGLTYTKSADGDISNNPDGKHYWIFNFEVSDDLDTTQPSPPANLSVLQVDNSIELTWDANNDTGLAGYNVYRAEQSFNTTENATQLNSRLINETRFTDTELEDGITYFYRVTAVDDSGNESELSNIVEILFEENDDGEQISSMLERVAEFGDFGSPAEVAVIDQLLYVVGRDFSDGFLVIYDISDVANPSQVNSFEFEDFEASDMIIENDILYIAGDVGLRIFDLSADLTNPTLLHEHTEVNNPENNEQLEITGPITKKDDLLFANSGIFGFMVLDISDLANPTFLDGFEFNFGTSDKFVVTTPTSGWMDDGGDLRHIDFSDPSNLVVASSDSDDYIELPGELYDFVVDGDTAYAVTWSGTPHRIFSIRLSERSIIDEINVADSIALGFDSSIDFHNESRKLAVRGVVDFIEVDATDAANLIPVKVHDGEAHVEFKGNYLFTGGGIFDDMFIYRLGDKDDDMGDDGDDDDSDSDGETTLFTEGFDGGTFPPKDWTQNVTNESYTWEHGLFEDFNFDDIDPENVQSATISYDFDQDEWLISPVIDLTEFTSPLLSFYALYGTDFLNAAVMKLLISTDSNHEEWQELWMTEDDGGSFEWRLVEVDLSNFKGSSSVKLAWQYVGNDGNSMGLDGIKLEDKEVATDIDDEFIDTPKDFVLHQNYPNPFNPTTTIEYGLPSSAEVRLTVYNVMGQEVATLVNQRQSAGTHSVNFDASRLSSGMYLYRIEAGEFTQTRKLMLVK